jgi:hypothetical protein
MVYGCRDGALGLVVRYPSFQRHDRRQRAARRRRQYQRRGAVRPVQCGIAREFLLPDDPKPMTVRFDVVNLFDSIYLIRDGSGIGVFAPQYGPRRGYFGGISKKF